MGQPKDPWGPELPFTGIRNIHSDPTYGNPSGRERAQYASYRTGVYEWDISVLNNLLPNGDIPDYYYDGEFDWGYRNREIRPKKREFAIWITDQNHTRKQTKWRKENRKRKCLPRLHALRKTPLSNRGGK